MMTLALMAALAAQTPSIGEQLDARLSALEAQIVPAPGVYRADQWIPEGGDLADAIHAIQLDPGCGPLDDPPRQKTGCKILIPRGIYETKTIHVCRMLWIEGAGGRGWGPATRIETWRETGIRIESAGWCEANGFGPPAVGGARAEGAWSKVTDLWLKDTGGVWSETSSAAIYSAGVHMQARATLRDVWIDGYTQGVRIVADVTLTESSTTGWMDAANTNVNSWSMQDVFITGSRHTGLYIDGGDTNAGYTLGLNLIGNCKDGDKYEEMGWTSCANLHDSSFLGNTHIATHSAHTRDRRGNEHHQYLTDSPNSRNVFVGAYAEIGNGAQEASANDLVLGGQSQFADTGSVNIQNGEINGFCSPDVGNGVLCVGNRAGGGTISFAATGPGWVGNEVLRLRPAVENGQPLWRWDIANLAAARVFDMIARDGPLGDRGDLLMRRRLRVPQCRAPDPINLAGLGIEPVGTGLGVCAVE